LRILPASGISLGRGDGLLESLPHLILPALVLALLPTALTAQAVASELIRPRGEGGGRPWLMALLAGLGALAGQTGGVLSALVLVETAFAMRGVGRLFMQAFMLLELGLATGTLTLYAALTLAGKLAAELFRWLKRLMAARAAPAPEAEPTPWRKTARRIWLIAALALLVLPLCQVLSGLAASADAAQEVDLSARGDGPSGSHLLGTDALGRDNLARAARGGANTVGAALGAALALTVLGGLGGALTGWLSSRRTLVFESLADVAALPGEALLMLPAVPLAALLVFALGPGSGPVALVAVIVALTPRLGAFFRALWAAAGEKPEPRQLLMAAATLFVGALFAALWAIVGLDYLGLGLRPPAPTLGAMVAESAQTLAQDPWTVLSAAVALWLPAFAFYTAVSALAGRFATKESLARLNE
jgi:peptide/nickel transport system permease protein